MDETYFLILLSVLMFVASYGIGFIPLTITFSESKLQLVSTFGAGLLVGTALAVIIPEGVRLLYMIIFSTQSKSKSEDTITKNNQIHDSNLSTLMGFTLVLGFILMLLIDQCSSKHGRSARCDVTATLGLVVHAAVDGVALGAAATTSHTEIEIIIFLAIMLHKAPAAFALVTFLLHEGLDKIRIKKHLLAFSLAAPLAALITFFGLSQEGKETLSSMNATGVAMLFSAGTFLYVATVHVLPEVTYRAGGILKKNQLFFLVLGTILPLFLNLIFHRND
ncbi:hypothetical protein PGB90_005385 [Kerria lacca]